MRIISDRKGNYMAVIEEINFINVVGDKITHCIGVIHNEVCVINNESGRIWNYSEFTEYCEKSMNTNWRSQTLKEEYKELYEKILSSFKRIERDRKIDEVFRDPNEYLYWLC